MAVAKEKDLDFLKQALRLARERSADGLSGPFGAVIAEEEKLVAQGWNNVVRTKDPTAHAEVVAIREACRKLNTHELDGCTLYASCEPCPMCLAAAYWAGIRRIVFSAGRRDAAAIGFDDEWLYDEVAAAPGERRLESIQAMREEGRAVLREWSCNPGKVMY